MRGALEALAARIFTQRATSEQIQGLAKSVERVQEAFNLRDQASMRSSKNEFYRVLFEKAQNEVTSMMLRTIRLRIIQLRGTSLTSPGRAKASIEEYWELIATIKARDEEAAHKTALRHVNNAAKSAIAILEKQETHAGKKAKPA